MLVPGPSNVTKHGVEHEFMSLMSPIVRDNKSKAEKKDLCHASELIDHRHSLAPINCNGIAVKSAKARNRVRRLHKRDFPSLVLLLVPL